MSAPLIPETVCDEQLPQLAALFDAQQMGARFVRALGNTSTLQLTDCQITRVKYRPGRNCVVSYRLRVLDPQTGRASEQRLSTLAMGSGESLPQFSEAQQQKLVPTALGHSVLHLPELETVIWVFPNDRKLTGLPVITDADRLQRDLLPAIVAESFGAQWQLSNLAHRVIHYVAERSCTVRVDLGLSHARTGAMMTRTLFGKTYCPGEDVRAWRAISQLWQSDFCQRGALLIPQPLAHQPASRTCWQSGLVGATLGEFEDDSAARMRWLSEAGATVATLHGAALTDLSIVTMADVVAKLEAAATVVARAHPSLQPALETLTERLISTADRAAAPLTATLHADLHLQNLFVTAGRVALIDLDDLCSGDPLQDLGSFAAALHYRALLRGEETSITARHIEQFIAAYGNNVTWEVSSAALAWHTATALIAERAYRLVTRLKPGRLALLNDIIALAQRLTNGL
jgi:hypothetical protein